MKDNENFKLIVSSTLPLAIVIMIFLVGGGMAYKYLTEFSNKVAQAQVEENTLTTKLNLLKSVSIAVGKDSTSATVALPEVNPSLTVLMQLKNQSSLSGVVVSDTRAGSGSTTEGQGYSKVGVTFTLAGSRVDVFKFIEDLSKLSPMIILDGVGFTESGGETTAEVKTSTFWADLPKTLPALTEPITALTDAEKSTLSKVSNLSQLPVEILPPAAPGGRDDPFSQ